MSLDKEVIQIILDAKAEEAKKAQKQLDGLGQSVITLKAKLDAGTISNAQFEKSFQTLHGKIQTTQTQLKSAGNAAGNAGQLMMQAGYAVDDLQFGFKGIANNIQPILQSIPALGAMAPVLSIIAIAAYQFYEHWDKVQELLGTGIPQPALTGPELLAANLKKASDEMDELAKKTRLEWYELEKLNKLRAEVKDLKEKSEADKNVTAAAGQLSEGEKATGEGFGKALAESGGSTAIDDYRQDLEGQKDGKGLVFNESKRKMTSVEDAVRDTFDAALKGDKISRDAIKKAMAGSKFAENIDTYSPEQQKKDERTAADDDADIKFDEEKRQRDKDTKAYRKKKQQEREDKDREVDDIVDQVGKDIADQEKKDKHDAIEKAEKATAGSGLDKRAEDALLRTALASGGQTGVARDLVAKQISSELQARGLSGSEADIAARDKVEKLAGKLGDEINEGAMNPHKMGSDWNGPQRIGGADFARSVESAGMADTKRTADATEAMKTQLTDLVRLAQQGPRLGP